MEEPRFDPLDYVSVFNRRKWWFIVPVALSIVIGLLLVWKLPRTYQATTTEFWGSMEAVGGPETYVLGGAFNCGKGQPGQVAAVSHGCPAALFRNVNVLNTVTEGGR